MNGVYQKITQLYKKSEQQTKRNKCGLSGVTVIEWESFLVTEDQESCENA